MDIYVGNLPYSVNADELRNVFTAYGEVADAKVISDKYSGRSKGFGFVQMPNEGQAEQAIEQLNDSDLHGRNIKVNQARPRQNNDRGGRRDRY